MSKPFIFILQAIVKQFAKLLDFVLKFDEAKMMNPALQVSEISVIYKVDNNFYINWSVINYSRYYILQFIERFFILSTNHTAPAKHQKHKSKRQ